jgi:hypothetical protein
MITKPARLFFVLFFTFWWVSCAGKPPVEVQQIPEAPLPPEAKPEGAPEPEESRGPGSAGDLPVQPEQAGLVFIPVDPPPLVPAPGVGLISRGASLSGEDRAALQDSFRAAYLDGLLKDLPLAGVLGSDQVHGWPDTNPSGWVQNWRSAGPVPNSWGIPSLILAIRGVESAREMGRVFIVDGEILDYYGISAGLNGANGDIGYGSPRGEKFVYNADDGSTGIAQRFDHGLIVISGEGQGSFLPEEPPSLNREPPPELGSFPEAPENGEVRAAFLTAWKMALDRNIEMVPDGPGQYLSGFSRDPDSPGAGNLEGLYIQTFNRRGALLILPESPGLPRHVRFLGPPFLGAFVSPKGGDFVPQLREGIAKYGFPLTDPLPYRADEDSAWQETQRFSRGWLRVIHLNANS